MFFLILVLPAAITAIATGVSFLEVYTSMLVISAAFTVIGLAIAARIGLYLTKTVLATVLVALMLMTVGNFINDYSVTTQRGCWETRSGGNTTKICEISFKGFDFRGETLDASIQKTWHQFRIETDDILGRNDFQATARHAAWKAEDTARLAFNRAFR